MNRFVHIDIPADDLDRAERFWTEAFGFTFQGSPDYPYRVMLTDGEGVGGIGIRNQTAGPVPIPTIGVDDVNAAVARIEAAGGKAISPKQPVGDMGFYRTFQDSEGNLFGVWEAAKRAERPVS